MNVLCPWLKWLVIGVGMTWRKMMENVKSDTIWKTYIKATACCCSFKGSHYIPVSKTLAFLCDYTDTAHSCFSLSFMIFFSFNLFFLPSNLIIVRLMGFWMWRGCRTGPGHGMTPLSAVSSLWLGPSSWLNDSPGELWFWHTVRLCWLSRADVWMLFDPCAGWPGDWAVGRWCIFYRCGLHAVCKESCLTLSCNW